MQFLVFKHKIMTDDNSETLKVFAGTWNMHGQDPPEYLWPFIVPGEHDIYAIATEECERSIEKSFVVRSKRKWERKLMDTMSSEYVLIRTHTLMAIHLALFVRRDLVPQMSDVSSTDVKTGFVGGTIGNKGAVGISFSLRNATFLFISCHFTAHQNKVKERNADFHRINSEMRLFPPGVGRSNDLVCERFDYVVWMGDLNYRIYGNRKVIDAVLRKSMPEVLINNDQLLLEQKRGHVFQGFEEGLIDFSPTYKYDDNSSRYDTSKKMRIPAWTDRVLYIPRTSLTLLDYGANERMLHSDHRPVYAHFLINLSQKEVEDRQKSSEENEEEEDSDSQRGKVCSIS